MTKGIARGQKVAPIKKQRSRELRGELTAAEQKLWSHLRRKQINDRKFRRQQVIEGFIVDFFCPVLSLAVEVDGDIHAMQSDYDAERDLILRLKGVKVVRFTNEEVLHETESVLEKLFELTQ